MTFIRGMILIGNNIWLFHFQVEKPTGRLYTIVNVSFDNLNDFVRFRKFCATPHIQMKLSQPASIIATGDDSTSYSEGSNEGEETADDANEFSDCDSVSNSELVNHCNSSFNGNKVES